jgi:hypothetical protein
VDAWPHAKIYAAASRYIRKSCARVPDWRYTKLDDIHAELSSQIALDRGERVIVSCYIDPSHWYVMTTARILGCYLQAFSLQPLDVANWDWGDFKHGGTDGIGIARIQVAGASSVNFAYEVGYASMAPIYYERFWSIKFPVLDKLAL